jgi:3-dehydroquinate dehydratase-2
MSDPFGTAGGLILLLSGPNLSLLGLRQPEIYGTGTLAEHAERAARVAAHEGMVLEHFQSDHEAALVAAVHGARDRAAAIVVNAGALSHYGWSLYDALASFEGVVVELHLSNPYAREPWRHRSVLTPVSDGSISGFGGLGYDLAVQAAVRLISARSGTSAP